MTTVFAIARSAAITRSAAVISASAVSNPRASGEDAPRGTNRVSNSASNSVSIARPPLLLHIAPLPIVRDWLAPDCDVVQWIRQANEVRTIEFNGRATGVSSWNGPRGHGAGRGVIGMTSLAESCLDACSVIRLF